MAAADSQFYFDDDFDSIVQAALDEYHVPGLSIAIVDGENVATKGYGLARFPDVPATADTLYFTGSTTKAMVSTLAAMLVHDEDKARFGTKQLGSPLQITTPIKHVLKDDFVLEDKCAEEQITIEDALSHRSGVDGRDSLYGPWLGDNPREITKRMRYFGSLDKPLRTTFQYNNIFYAVVAQVIEAMAESKIGQVIKDWLWSPLGMNSSFWNLRDVFEEKRIDISKQMSRGYYWIESAETHPPADQGQRRDGLYTPEPFLEPAGIASAGATISSVSDYVKWIKALIKAARSEKSEPGQTVTRTVFQETTKPRTIVNSMPASPIQPHLHPPQYALGWVVLPLLHGYNHPIITHSGGLTGYGTQLYVLPNDRFGVVTMGNTALTSNLVGELVAATLIARKIGLAGDTREKFINILRSPLRTNKQSETDGEKVAVHQALAKTERLTEQAPSSQEEPNTTADVYIPDLANFFKPQDTERDTLTKLQGTYENPAWGKYQVEFRDVRSSDVFNKPYLSGNEAQRKAQRDVRTGCLGISLEVRPLSKKTWFDKFLLHPRKTGHAAKERENTDVHFFDLELVGCHGNVEDDSVPRVPTGCEEGPTDKCQIRKIWEGKEWCELGAAIVIEHDASNQPGDVASGADTKLGMILANTKLFQGKGSDAKEWQNEMTWFEKV